MAKDNYLEQEFLDLLSKDSSLFEFLDSAAIDGLWFWDLENPEEEWMSPQFWRTLGFDPETKLHKASEWQHLINADDLSVAYNNFERHCEDPNHPYDQIVRYTHADGSTVYVRCRGRAFRDETGKPIRMLGAHTDVTDLMHAQDALLLKTQQQVADSRKLQEAAEHLAKQKTEEVLKLSKAAQQQAISLDKILSRIDSAVLVVSHDGEIRFANKAAHDIFEYVDGILEGAKVEVLVPSAIRPDHAVLMAHYNHDAKEKRMGGDRMVKGVKADGSEVPLEVGLSPFEYEGEKVTLVTAIDISERAITDRKLREAMQLLEVKNNDLTDLSRMIAHDLRDPVGRLVSQSYLIATFMDKGDMDKAKEWLKIMQDTALHSVNLISALYDYSVLQHTDDSDRMWVSVSLQNVIETVAQNMQDVIQSNSASLFFADVGFSVLATKPLMVQTIQNLVGNAIKYGPDGATEIKISSKEEGDSVIVSICDNGPGIADKDKELIFSPFKRVGDAVRVEGAGFGLATCRKIVDYLDGRIWCEDGPDGGACFCINMPKP